MRTRAWRRHQRSKNLKRSKSPQHKNLAAYDTSKVAIHRTWIKAYPGHPQGSIACLSWHWYPVIGPKYRYRHIRHLVGLDSPPLRRRKYRLSTGITRL